MKADLQLWRLVKSGVQDQISLCIKKGTAKKCGHTHFCRSRHPLQSVCVCVCVLDVYNLTV